MSTDRLNKLQEFLKSSPNDSFLLFALAKEYEALGQIDQALVHFLKLKETGPKYIGLYYHLGKLYERIQEEMLAQRTYTEGINLAKELGDFHALSELNTAKMNLDMTLGN